jgi:hypothetical protein
MNEQGKVFPIPCRKCGKLTPIRLTPGTCRFQCKTCAAVTDVTSRPLGAGFEVKTALAASDALPHGDRLGG